MPRFQIHDIQSLEHSPTAPGTLQNKLSELIFSSHRCMAKVEAINPETGEYRVVLQGTLDKDEFDQTWVRG